MPQLIAMIIVVVGALIYMFQTFGGTGDKIEGIAQKSSILTEVANVKNGIQLALRSNDISEGTTLVDLAVLEYFAEQMNDEIGGTVTAANKNTVTTNSGIGNEGVNTYSAISFGGEDNPSMFLSLITPATGTANDSTTKRPGIRVELLGTLAQNAGFLESQIANDLGAVADIDRITTNGGHVTQAAIIAATPTDAQNTDGIFTIYYKDLPTGYIQDN